MVESIGRRIAYLRQKKGWTQQSLANRLAMSRVAISHIEMDLMIPSERSITLMAGVFKLSPMELVDGTTYPKAKAERLPELTAMFTDLEMKLALLQNDMEWLGFLENSSLKQVTQRRIINKWTPILDNLLTYFSEDHESDILLEMRLIVKKINDQLNHHLL